MARRKTICFFRGCRVTRPTDALFCTKHRKQPKTKAVGAVLAARVKSKPAKTATA